MNLTGTPFCEELPTAQLHWMIADREQAITVEFVESGMHIYDNQVGVMTNNPPFEMQMFLLNQYMNLSPKQPENHFAEALHLRLTAVVWEEWDFREICLPLRVSLKLHLPE